MKPIHALALGLLLASPSAFADRHERETAPDGPLAEHIRQADRDGDGRISRTEHDAAMRNRGDRHFKEADRDGDGFLTVEEIRHAFQQARHRLDDRRMTAPRHEVIRLDPRERDGFDKPRP